MLRVNQKVTVAERRFVQPELFDDPAVLQSSLKLTEIDTFITETKNLIKHLVAENRSPQRSMNRYDIERSVVDAYKSLSNASEARYKISDDKLDEQQQQHYKKMHAVLKQILFKGTNKKLILNTPRKIHDNILKAVQGLKETTARDMARLWRNLLSTSILAAKGVAQKEFPIVE